MQRGRLLIILGVVLGLATIGAVVFLLISSSPEPVSVNDSSPTAVVERRPTEIPTTDVIVALQNIARGSEFVAGSIGPRPWPSQNVPPDVIVDEIETIGKVAKTEIVQGQIIVRGMLTDLAGTSEASFLIPSGRVAVPYTIDRQTSVAYAIHDGDYVDILVTAFFVDVDEAYQTELPNKVRFFFPTLNDAGGATSVSLSSEISQGRFEIGSGDIPAIVLPNGKQIPRRVAQLTVESAKIIKVGAWKEPPPPPSNNKDGAPSPPPSPLPNVATIAVTPQDALVLLWLRKNGIYSEMALRAAGEENADHLTEAVTLQYMLTRFNIAVPPKIEFVMTASLTDLNAQQTAQQ